MTQSGEIPPQVSVCFLFVGLAVGCITTYILSRLAPTIPYAVVVFLSGVLCAIGVMLTDFHVLGDSIYQWMNIEPHLLLYIFLPALIFGDAMGLNIHHMKGTFWSGLLLGIPGSVIGTVVLAAFTRYLLPFDWSWRLSFVFGAILSATDTVSVFALLKQADASPRLTILIVQESLYNDGAALVLFDLFFSRLYRDMDADESPRQIFFYCLRVLVFSPLVGIGLGLLTVYGLRLTNRRTNSDDVIIQVALTVCCAYLSFFVSEYVCDVSGVLGCCCAGIVLAWLGPPLITQHETMHSVWGTLEWMGNTLIFLLAGLLFVIKTQEGVTTYLNFTALDFLMIFVTYVAVLGSRAIMMAVCYPFMRTKYGANVSIAECVFLTWTGVRGAVSITLALVLQESAAHNEIVTTHDEAHKLFFIVGGVAALTLIINATQAKRLIFALGLVEETSEEIRMMQHYARKRLHKRINDLVRDLKRELPLFDIYLVAEYCKVIVLNSLHPSSIRGGKFLSNKSSKSSQKIKNLATKATDIIASGLKSLRDRNQDRDYGIGLGLASSDVSLLMCANVQQTEDAKNPGVPDSVEEAIRIMTMEGMEGVPMHTSHVSSEKDAAFMTSASSHSENSVEKPLNGPGGSRKHSRHVSINPRNISDEEKSSRAAKAAAASAMHPNPNPTLLVHVRLAFLGVVRMVYWKLINEGKLPRNSAAALALLFSIDSAQDSNNSSIGLMDFEALKPAFKYSPFGLSLLKKLGKIADFFVNIVGYFYRSCWKRRSDQRKRRLSVQGVSEERDLRSGMQSRSASASVDESHLPSRHSQQSGETSSQPSPGHTSTSILEEPNFFTKYFGARVEFRRHENSVYVLTSFIEAHEHAQKMVALYLGEDDVVIDTMEQEQVVRESEAAVKLARQALSRIDKETVSYSVSRQVARILLHAQEEMLEQLQHEGILRPRDANLLLSETRRDYELLENEWMREIWDNFFGWSAWRSSLSIFPSAAATSRDRFLGEASNGSGYSDQSYDDDDDARAIVTK